MFFFKMISGLTLLLNVIDETDEETILKELDEKRWSFALKRRTQHYGFEYDYKDGSVVKKAPPFPFSVEHVGKWLWDTGIFTKMPDQCIVNEYTRLQGIGGHVDSLKFGPTVASLSLGGDTNFIFSKGVDNSIVYVPRRSLLVLNGEARYKYKHEIPRRSTVEREGEKVEKEKDYRRVSLTFRTKV